MVNPSSKLLNYGNWLLPLACLLLLVVALPFVNYAPNRLLSGEGRWLWQLAPWLMALQVGGALLLILLCWLPGRRPLLLSLLMLDVLDQFFQTSCPFYWLYDLPNC